MFVNVHVCVWGEREREAEGRTGEGGKKGGRERYKERERERLRILAGHFLFDRG